MVPQGPTLAGAVLLIRAEEPAAVAPPHGVLLFLLFLLLAALAVTLAAALPAAGTPSGGADLPIGHRIPIPLHGSEESKLVLRTIKSGKFTDLPVNGNWLIKNSQLPV